MSSEKSFIIYLSKKYKIKAKSKCIWRTCVETYIDVNKTFKARRCFLFGVAVVLADETLRCVWPLCGVGA